MRLRLRALGILMSDVAVVLTVSSVSVCPFLRLSVCHSTQHTAHSTKHVPYRVRGSIILVSNRTFLDLGIFGDIIVFVVCLKNEFFRSCFRQSAKCKMTAQTRRKNHVFSKNSTL